MRRALMMVVLALGIMSACSEDDGGVTGTPQQPVQVQVLVCSSGSCITGVQPSPAPGTTGATCPAQVTSVGINVPTSISIAQGNSYVVDATPHGPDGQAFPVGCAPLPPITWFVSSACRVGDDSLFRTLLAGVSLGTCQLHAVVNGVPSPTKAVLVLP